MNADTEQGSIPILIHPAVVRRIVDDAVFAEILVEYADKLEETPSGLVD